MPRRTLRYVLGTLRLRTRSHLLDLRARLRRRPGCASAVPRPPRPRRGRRLRLTHALLASDLNPSYLDFWPLARRAWLEIGHVEPILVVVGASADVPENLRPDPLVHVFEPVPSLHTAFQAQCVRLLYPALLAAEGGVVVSDVDMVPLDRRYFHRPAEHVDEDHLVAYRDVLLGLGEIPVCYNAARPAIWADIFEIADLSDVTARLAAWGSDVSDGGEHGGCGWTTDQRILFETLLPRGRRCGDVWILDDRYTRFLRLERAYVEKWGRLSETAIAGIHARKYADFHCLHPHEGGYRELNELVVELAVEAERR